MLRQDPTENLFSFICSSNNNIQRIGGMVETLRRRYGKYVGDAEGMQWHQFPTLEALSREGIEEVCCEGLRMGLRVWHGLVVRGLVCAGSRCVSRLFLSVCMRACGVDAFACCRRLDCG